jgi:hypothetical protein
MHLNSRSLLGAPGFKQRINGTDIPGVSNSFIGVARCYLRAACFEVS